MNTLFLFALVFIVLPFGTSWYEIPKVLVAWVWIAIAGFLFFWKKPNHRRIHPLILGLFALSIVDIIFFHTHLSFFGNAFRLQGTLMLWSLLLWAVIVPPQVSKKYTWISLAVLLIWTVMGRLDSAGRAVGPVGEANSLGAYALFLAPLATSPLAFVPTIIIVFLSGSRSALIGLIAEGIVLLGSLRFRLGWPTVIAVLFLSVSVILPFMDTKQAFDSRATIWQTAIQAGVEKPLLGWGIGNTELGLKVAAEHIQSPLRYQYVDSSHNVFLDWWVQGGVVGLGLFIALIGIVLKNLIQKNERLLLASFLGILAVMLFNPVSIAILIPFWFLAGIGL